MIRKILFSFLIILGAATAWATPNFTKQNTLLISSATPQVVDSSTSPYRAYFIRDYRVYSSTSSDGITWYEEPGTRVSSETTPTLGFSSITACTLLRLDDNGYRMLYSVNVSTFVWRIYSATSSDGLYWANDTGARITVASSTFLGCPRLVELSDTNWRLYYLQDVNGGDDQADRQIITSVSTDEGVTWSAGSIVVSDQAGELATLVRTDGRIRLYYTQPLTGETTNSVLVSAMSSNGSGTNFTIEQDTRISTDSADGALSYPVVFRSTDSFRYRLLYAFTVTGSSIPHVFSGLTTSPDPTDLTPDSVLRTDPDGTFTIEGEIFGSTPTVVLRKSGQSDITGTNVTRNSDQSFTADFATNAQAMGTWDLVVTNPDGAVTTLSNALRITFQSGSVSIIDNVLRLSSGGTSQISVTIYDEGKLTLKLYTLDGKLVNTIYEGDGTLGTNSFSWNGRTAQGNLVASGVYVLRVEGPKLDTTQKIVVIR